jgi:hypothetical protein
MTILHPPRQHPGQAEPDRPGADPADRTTGGLTSLVMSPLAECVDSAVGTDEWFPVATRPDGARAEGARALAVCAVCPVRAECLELSLRIWHSGGEYGIWGGLVEADRAEARREWLTGVPVTTLLTEEAGSRHLPSPRRP